MPLTAIEPSSLALEINKSGKTPYGKIKYSNTVLQLEPFSVITPSFPILKYDSTRGRIDFDLACDMQSCTKFKAIQDHLINLLYQQQYDWFQSHSITLDDVRAKFQPFLQGTVLSIYLSTLLRSGKPIWIWKSNTWSTTLKPGVLQAGQSVRLLLRLSGIQSFFNVNSSSLKCHIVMHPIALLIRD
jgi:hypothetical protein